MVNEILLLLSTGILGVFLGSQITEAVLFVPYWKALDPNRFFELHQTYGKKIYQFFAPLTVAATFLPLATVFYGMVSLEKESIILAIMGVSTFLFFITYFLFFKKANKHFADRSISDEELPSALLKWESWHWGRIVFEFIAFSCSLLLLMRV